jgi:hypothetical protein
LNVCEKRSECVAHPAPIPRSFRGTPQGGTPLCELLLAILQAPKQDQEGCQTEQEMRQTQTPYERLLTSDGITEEQKDPFITLFLSAYEENSWADADISKPDAVDRQNPAVDMLATRKADGTTLAVEHTIIEPFVGDKEGFASFGPAFLAIEQDHSLLMPGRWLEVSVPVGTLRKQAPIAPDAIVRAVHGWIPVNRLTLPQGRGKYQCQVANWPGNPSFEISLNVRVTP